MPTTTALVAIQRMIHMTRDGQVSDFSDTDKTGAYLVCLNSALREVLETAEWDFLTRHDGELRVVPATTYTAALSTSSVTTIVAVGQNDFATYHGNFQTRIVPTGSTVYGGTSFAVAQASHPAASDVYLLRGEYPNSAGFSLINGMIYVVDYQLPSTVRDVLSVRHEQDEVKLGFIDKQRFDEIEPAAHLVTSDSPDMVTVGGSVTSTITTGGTATTALGLTVWPVPSVAYVLHYAYRYLHPAVSAVTDLIDAPNAHVDLIIDKALAKAYRSGIKNDPQMADTIEADVARRFSRLLSQNSPQPQRRMMLRSHDSAGSSSQFGSKPANPRTFYTP